VQTNVCEGAYRITLGYSDEMASSGKRSNKSGQLRIIGGSWRGRKLSFTPADGLRPTSDRIRETLFNWLANTVQGARCADLFAGSGALGLEALSRGAVQCDFVDTSKLALASVAGHLAVLDASSRGTCQQSPAKEFLHQTDTPYDIVFVDPPYHRQLVEPVCALLAQRQLLAPGALIYIESASNEPAPVMPDDWQLHRSKTSGGVAYRLYSTNGTGDPS
jgi:16S rRNA (guanine966-N2)-methyltransferase